MAWHLRCCQALLQGLQDHLPNAIRGTELQGRQLMCGRRLLMGYET